jgi:hypothetical protein
MQSTVWLLIIFQFLRCTHAVPVTHQAKGLSFYQNPESARTENLPIRLKLRRKSKYSSSDGISPIVVNETQTIPVSSNSSSEEVQEPFRNGSNSETMSEPMFNKPYTVEIYLCLHLIQEQQLEFRRNYLELLEINQFGVKSLKKWRKRFSVLQTTFEKEKQKNKKLAEQEKKRKRAMSDLERKLVKYREKPRHLSLSPSLSPSALPLHHEKELREENESLKSNITFLETLLSERNEFSRCYQTNLALVREETTRRSLFPFPFPSSSLFLSLVKNMINFFLSFSS